MIVGTTVKSIQDIMRQDVGVDGDAQRISQLCWMFFSQMSWPSLKKPRTTNGPTSNGCVGGGSGCW
jgi:hypothetical protein